VKRGAGTADLGEDEGGEVRVDERVGPLDDARERRRASAAQLVEPHNRRNAVHLEERVAVAQ